MSSCNKAAGGSRFVVHVLTIAAVLTSLWPVAAGDAEFAQSLIEKMARKTGTMERLHQLRDVEYTYVYRDNAAGTEDISLERYVFDGELSWARYSQRARTLPELRGVMTQGFDGKQAWVALDGQLIDDPQALRMALFLRKTNYYWFAMMQKLLDPGLIYSYEGRRAANGIEYHLVKVTFAANVGAVQDTYLLYLNPRTGLVDQFLFTVMDFGLTEPLLMQVQYKKVKGVLLPAERKYAPANWDGEVRGDVWTDEIMSGIRFNNQFERSMFSK